MTMPPSSPVTQLLVAISQGDESASEKLWGLIYDELHQLARQQMAREVGPRTLQPTALVHEAYLRLIGGAPVHWVNSKHFFAVAGKIMRHIRVDDARRRKRLKRGGPEPPSRTQEIPIIFDQDPTELLTINEALVRLEEIEPRQAEVVTLRYFAGLSVDECAVVLGVSSRTVDSDWFHARAWLHRELSDSGAETQ